MNARRFQGFYERRIFPWLNDKLTVNPEIAAIRTEVLAAARGRVLEIGFGTGLNLQYYPATVERVVAIEPNEGMRIRARDRARRASFPVGLVGGEAEHVPAADASFDTVVTVLTLCSVSNPDRALAELSRILRDDGTLVLVEHGLADDPGVARWQHRLDRLQGIIACGCHLNRPTRHLVERAGFRFEKVRTFYFPGAPRTHGWFTVGTATKARVGAVA